MNRTRLLLLAAGVLLLPSGAAAAVKLTLTPTEAPIRITETGEFTAVVTGNVTKTVKLQVCDGFGANCVTGGSTTLGTIVEIGRDASNNPIARYTAPAVLPPTLSCQAVVLGCQVKLQALLKFTKNGVTRKKKSLATVVLAAPGVIRRASVASDGTEGNGQSGGPILRSSTGADGRFVTFQSSATNLVAGDANGFADIFVRDTCGEVTPCTPSTIRVSVASDGTEPNDSSNDSHLSVDGRFVGFRSSASNLVPNDTGFNYDVFLRDTCAGAANCTPSTVMVTVATDGTQGDFGGARVSLSANGRFVVFLSNSTNLVPGDTNGFTDVFVRDTCAGVPSGCTASTVRVSVANNGSEGNDLVLDEPPSISAGGRFVAFNSRASNLVANDTNGIVDLFVRDTCAGASGPCTLSTTRVSVANDGSEANGLSGSPSISADGRFVAFGSLATNLVPGGTNGGVHVRDTCFGTGGGCTPTTAKVALASDGSQENDFSQRPSISADGRFVAFESFSSNLVAGDTNGKSDVFVRDTCAGAAGCTPSTVRVSVTKNGSEANGESFQASLSPDGRFVSMSTNATNLESGDTNGVDDVYAARTSFVRPPLAYVAITAAITVQNNVAVIDTGTNSVVATTGALSGIDDPIGVALSPDGLRAYVTLQFSNEVVVLNTLTNTEVARIAVGSEPIIPAVTPDGTRLYVPNQFSNNVMVIDTGTNTVTATIGMGTTPVMVAITADGKKAYVSNIDSNEIKIIDTDPASGTFHTVIGTIPVTGGPAVLAFSPDGSSLYASLNVSNQVAVINTSTNMVTTKISVGAGPIGVAVTPDGSRLYVANSASASVSVINTATNSVIKTIAVAALPQLIAIAPEGPTVYVTHDTIAVNTVTVIDVASNTVKATIAPGGSAAGIALRTIR